MDGVVKFFFWFFLAKHVAPFATLEPDWGGEKNISTNVPFRRTSVVPLNYSSRASSHLLHRNTCYAKCFFFNQIYIVSHIILNGTQQVQN